MPACLLIGAVACIPTLITKKFARWQGVLLLGLYAVYMVLTVFFGDAVLALVQEEQFIYPAGAHLCVRPFLFCRRAHTQVRPYHTPPQAEMPLGFFVSSSQNIPKFP